MAPAAAATRTTAMAELMASPCNTKLGLLGHLAMIKSLLLLVMAAAAAAAEVIELDDAGFEDAITKYRHILVDFYAPWCGHCIALSPQLDELATKVSDSSLNLVIAKLDADKFKRLASKESIDAYPTLKLFTDGVPTEYTGPHKAELMFPLLKRMMAPDLVHVHNKAELATLLTDAGNQLPVFIGFPGSGQELEKELVKLAGQHKLRAWFAIVKAADQAQLAAGYGLSKVPGVVVQHVDHQLKKHRHDIQGGSDLTSFVKENLLPSVTHLNDFNLDFVKEDGRTILLVVLKDQDQVTVDLLDKVKELAEVHSPDFVFAVLDASGWPELAKIFHADEDPRLRALIWDRGTSYYMAHDVDEDIPHQIDNLVKEYNGGTARKISTKRPPLGEQLIGFLGQNGIYLILFLVTTVLFVPAMGWKSAPPADRDE